MPKDNIEIQTYMGYGNNKELICKGRILEQKKEISLTKGSWFRNVFRTLNRANSNELSNITISLFYNDWEKEVCSNTEGYYLCKIPISNLQQDHSVHISLNAHLKIKNIPLSFAQKEAISNQEIIIPSKKASFGVISDIDDTILKTDVLSFLGWRVIYNTFFYNALQRKPILKSNIWYQKLHLSNNVENPFFYVSNSPWNLYSMLKLFIEAHHFPLGPILLRDFGIKEYDDDYQNFETHKIDEIESILSSYPNLPFVLIGDGGQHDADTYIKIKKKHPDQIKYIFVYRLGKAKRQQKIEKLFENETNCFFIKSAEEGITISSKIGLINYPT